MKIGILNAIHPETSKVNWNGTPVDAYIRFFKGIDASLAFTGYEAARGQLPAAPDECDAYVVTGSPKGTYDGDGWIEALAQFLRDSYQAGKKLVGICFGHQILAHALGGHSEKSEKGYGFGVRTFDIVKTKPWMTGEPQQCSLYFAHQDQVQRLPPGAELLGGSDFCPNTMYTIDGRVLGIQGHPEFTPGIMEDIRARIADKLEPAAMATAVASLQSAHPDNQLVGQWIINFLRGDKEINREPIC